MILKGTRISTSSGAGKVGGHVLKGADNELIEVLEGSPDDLNDMVEDARDVGAKYAIRHVVISPKEAMTRAEAEVVAALWRAEFQTGDRPWMLVEHQKRRADGSGFDRHWHMLIGEVSPSTGRVLSCRNDYARNEKLARLAELSLGHQVTAGRHNKAVVAALTAEGRTAEADALRHLAAAPLPNSAYTSDAFQTAKRNGLNKAEATAAVRAAWERSDTAAAFAAALAESGLRVEQGRKRWIVVGTDTAGDRIEVGSVDRLARAKAGDVAARLAPPAQEKTHVREAEAPAADRGRPRSHGREGSLGGTQDGSVDRRDADRGGEVGRPERDRADHRTPSRARKKGPMRGHCLR